ncbi:MAG: hypothetical protein KDK91_28770, partial [Gammaproteobacteria bacterium]|nr:hypothetical protein [Gammaproteobacteria bacterium]
YINTEWRERSDAPRIGSRESRRAATSFHEVGMYDARPALEAGELGLDRTGFTLVRNRPVVEDFFDDAAVTRDYHPQMQAIVRELTGASRVLVYNHLVRTENPTDFNDAYSRFVHCDYNVARIGEMSHELLERHGLSPQPHWRYAWYNTWQPFDHQVQQNPLSVINAESLPLADVIDYYYTGRGRDSLVAAPVYSPEHRFYYFPLMSTEELLVMKQMDNRQPGRGTIYCPHTAFDDPSAPEDALPRRSIETRLMAVFE